MEKEIDFISREIMYIDFKINSIKAAESLDIKLVIKLYNSESEDQNKFQLFTENQSKDSVIEYFKYKKEALESRLKELKK